jgi:hypothetical protein
LFSGGYEHFLRKFFWPWDLEAKSSQQRTYAEFLVGEGKRGRVNRQKTENNQDLSQVEAPCEDWVKSPAVVI